MAETKSDWHEQASFADCFFPATRRCRYFQEGGDLVRWSSALQSKMVLCAGILDSKNKEEIKKAIKYLMKTANKYDYLKSQSKMYNKKTDLPEVSRELVENLVLIEIDLDTEVNKKMPFLNIKDKGSFDDM